MSEQPSVKSEDESKKTETHPQSIIAMLASSSWQTTHNPVLSIGLKDGCGGGFGVVDRCGDGSPRAGDPNGLEAVGFKPNRLVDVGVVLLAEAAVVLPNMDAPGFDLDKKLVG